MNTKSTGGVIGIIVVIIVILVGGIFFWGSRISPAREKAAMEKQKADEAAKMDANKPSQQDDTDTITSDVNSLGDIDVKTDLPDLTK